MPIRVRKSGKLEWRFTVDGHQYSGVTDLADTERNRIKVGRIEAEKRRLVLEGRASELRLQVQPFSNAADQFIEWAKGEYRDHPNSWKRLSVSMTSAKVFFGRRPLSSVTRGNLEDYKVWRRTKHQVREVTLRHDLHALSLLFQYGAKHNWCKGNAVEEVDIPSDAAAVRMHVLTPAEEAKYLAAIDALIAEKLARNLKYIADRLKDLRDLAMLMLNQGCRPEELREMEQCSVDLAKGYLRVEKGKSKAARRRLRLTAESLAILAERLKTQGRWVFPGKTPDKHIGAHQRLHDAALEKSGLSFVPYDLRHTCATRWVESGVSIATIAKWLGHSNLRTVQKYIHLSDEHLDAHAERVEQEWLEKRWQALQKESPQSEGSDRVVN